MRKIFFLHEIIKYVKVSSTTCFPLNIWKNLATPPMGHASWTFLPKSRTPTLVINAARKRVNRIE
jgi:hypothetical protein